MKKQIDLSLKDKIQSYIKNKMDISALIEGYDISNLDLSRAIITSLNASDDVLSNVNFSDAIIGGKEDKVFFNRTRLEHCSFIRTQFLGTVYFRYAYLLNCNFKEAFIPYIDYKFSQWQNCSFCDAVLAIGTGKGIGAIFDKNFFSDLSKHWGIVVIPRSEYEQLTKEYGNGQASTSKNA